MCDFNEAKYTCPKCEVKTCCLDCLKIHKKELNCNGIRDRTKYIPIKNITESDLMNDYVFLENCTNYTIARKRDKIKRITGYHRTLPAQLNKLKAAAQERSITLQFLLQNFEKHQANSTFYDWQTKIIHWRVEWRFLNANNRKCIDERCSELDTITNLVSKYFEANDEYTGLEYYRSKGLANVRFLLKAEGVRCSRNRYYSLDQENTLAENLRGRTIVEFPVITIVYHTDCDGFDIIDSGMSHLMISSTTQTLIYGAFNFTDEEDVEEETRKHKSLYFGHKSNAPRPPLKEEKIVRNAETNADDIDMSDDEKPISPANFLFSNDIDSDEANNDGETMS